MAGKVLNYYAGGNTARGFYSLYDSNIEGLDRVFILKGGPGTGKSSLIKKIGNIWSEKGYDIEFLHCSSDTSSVDGVIIRALGVGIVDGTAPHVIEPKAPGAIEEYVNLGEAWDSDFLAEYKVEILEMAAKKKEAYQAAYHTFARALKVHDDWERYYIHNMDFEAANELTNTLIDTLFTDKSVNRKADVRHRFLGAATPAGAKDYVPNLTEGLTNRYFIKGRPGSGKSTMLKKLAKASEEKGFDVEVYHCGFDPYSLDMIIVRELGFAIFDSTAPHEYFPDREGDVIVDMYETTIRSGTDERYEKDIKLVKERYTTTMKDAIEKLAEAKNWHEKLEKIYVNAMDYSVVDKWAATIQAEIEKIAEAK
ncbi:PRK06851 family protein [Sutcliffiella halmapala]|uniref:PRK06851 family protein n=1 Tax=Sutcliffiella halmapala TaxID=79882 RepID=UPI000994C150|nr:PRK06851 family protein [Sutcliffiella halmapala]